MAKKSDHDHDHPVSHDNDNGNDHTPAKQMPVAAAAMGSTALTALAALGTGLARVDTSGAGSSGLPTLLFKARENNGTYMYGQRRTIPDEGGRWAINVFKFERGWICFNDANKRVGERLLPVTAPMLDPTELQDHGFPWQEQWAVGMKCISGPDAGVEVIFKSNTVGGIGAIKGLIEEVGPRINGGQYGDQVAPIVLLNKNSYNNEYGKQMFPVFEIVDWMPIAGPTPNAKPKPEPEPPQPKPPAPVAGSDQPRRRRVA
jgi:hypothetical protein